jgi:hypothetical protein
MPAPTFRPVPGFEHRWHVSKDGQVWSVHLSRVLKGCPYGNGYRAVIYRTDSTSCGKASIGIHRLVALAWLGPAPSPKHIVNHKNLNKTDNRVDNLEWVTRSEDLSHAWANGCFVNRKPTGQPKGSKHSMARLTENDVRFIRKHYQRGIPNKPKPKWNGEALAKHFGVSKSQISSIVLGNSWAHIK